MIIRTKDISFRTSNEIERVQLLVIELEHLNFGFERTDIEHRLDLLNHFLVWNSNTLFLASND